MNHNRLMQELKRRLTGGSSKVIRFILNALSGTPFVGGIISAGVAAWSEDEQDTFNKLVGDLMRIKDDEIVELRNALARIADSSVVVAGSISFNPNSGELLESFDATSLSDLGTLDFAVTFSQSIEGRDFTIYGSGPVKIESVTRSTYGLRLRLEEPAPDRITLVLI